MVETIIAIPIVIGLTEVIKRLGLPSKYAPLTALVFGVVFSLLADGFSTASILNGIIYGLSASGLYSGTKAVVKTEAPQS